MSLESELARLGPDGLETVLGRATKSERQYLLALIQRYGRLRGLRPDPIPWGTDEPVELLRRVAPQFFSKPLSVEHEAIWEWVWDLQPGVAPEPLVVVLPRGRGKSTSLEVAAVLAGAHNRRRFVWYVSGSQQRADAHVASIAAILESSQIAQMYPEMGERRLGKFGNQKSWRRERLWTASGFLVEAVGLDVGTRGVKAEEQRPDWVILDDVDESQDTPLTVAKKLETITQAIIPAGSTDVAVSFVQNLVHKNSLMRRVADPEAFDEDQLWLRNNRLIGPVPAIRNMEAEQVDHPTKPGRKLWRITRGEPTWVGQPIEALEAMLNSMTLPAFEREFNHSIEDPPGGIFNHITWRRCDWDEARAMWPAFVDIQVWVDPAVTDKDDSDCMGISAGAVAQDGTIYALWAWEDRTTPTDALRRAILKAVDLGASTVGVETDQGGDTWFVVFERVCEQLEREGLMPADRPRPRYADNKAGAVGSKVERASQMVPDYEQEAIVHVRGTHRALEAALGRFPKTKPFDLTDSWSWCVRELRLLVPLIAPDRGALPGVRRSDWVAPASEQRELDFAGGWAMSGVSARGSWSM